MMVVIDASVAIKWFILEPGTKEAIRLLDDGQLLFVAPDIFPAEVVNGLLKQHRKGALIDEALDEALFEFEAAMPQLVPSVSVMERATALARRLSHPIYDCIYLALAERRETVFVTADTKFVTTCRKMLPDDQINARLKTLDTFGMS